MLRQNLRIAFVIFQAFNSQSKYMKSAYEVWKLAKSQNLNDAEFKELLVKEGIIIKNIALGGLCKTQFYMKPTIGRIVIYNTTDADKAKMEAASKINGGCNKQDKLPAIIVAVWSETTVNLKVICDGNLELWATSSQLGDAPYNWNWPVIEK